MKKTDMSKKAPCYVATLLNKMLKVDANSTSCSVVYQPKIPKGIEKYRK